MSGKRDRLVPDGLIQHFLVGVIAESSREPRVSFLYTPDEKRQLPKMTLEFLYPDIGSIRGHGGSDGAKTEHYVFVMTGHGGVQQYGFCNRYIQVGRSYPVVMCIISAHPFHALFRDVLEVAQARFVADPGAGIDFIKRLAGVKPPFHKQGVCRVDIRGKALTETLLFSVDHPIDYPFVKSNLTKLLACLSPDDVLIVFNALLLEKRLIVLSKSLPKLSSCVHALRELLFPMSWQHIFIPILPIKHIKFTCAPMPFLVGIHSGTMDTLLEQPMNEAILVNLDDKSLHMFGSESEELKNVLPEELTTKLRKRLRRKEARVSPRFAHSCFVSFFAVLFAPLRWQWRDAKGEFDCDRLLQEVKSSHPDLYPCFEHIRDSQMFEMWTREQVRKSQEKNGTSGGIRVGTFDVLQQLCSSNPTSFKTALKNLLEIHATRYQSTLTLPPIPKRADIIDQIAHSTISNTKMIAGKAMNRLDKLKTRFIKKKKRSKESTRASTSPVHSSSGATASAFQPWPASPDRHKSTPNSTSRDLAASPVSSTPVSSAGALGAPTQSTMFGLSDPHIHTSDTDFKGTHAGELLRERLQRLRPLPNFYETALQFTSNTPNEKRSRSDMLEELTAGSAVAASARTISGVIFDRLGHSKGKNWRHAHEALWLLLHLIHNGGDQVVFRAIDERARLREMTGYRHTNQATQARIRTLAKVAYQCACNPFTLRRKRRFAISDGKDKKIKCADVGVGVGVGGSNSRHKRRVSIASLRSNTLFYGQGGPIPTFSRLHALLRPPQSPAGAATEPKPPQGSGAPTPNGDPVPVSPVSASKTMDILGWVTSATPSAVSGGAPKQSDLDDPEFDPFGTAAEEEATDPFTALAQARRKSERKRGPPNRSQTKTANAKQSMPNRLSSFDFFGAAPDLTATPAKSSDGHISDMDQDSFNPFAGHAFTKDPFSQTPPKPQPTPVAAQEAAQVVAQVRDVFDIPETELAREDTGDVDAGQAASGRTMSGQGGGDVFAALVGAAVSGIEWQSSNPQQAPRTSLQASTTKPSPKPKPCVDQSDDIFADLFG